MFNVSKRKGRETELTRLRRPFALCIATENIQTLCHECLEKPEHLLRCSGCRKAKYCSRECQVRGVSHLSLSSLTESRSGSNTKRNVAYGSKRHYGKPSPPSIQMTNPAFSWSSEFSSTENASRSRLKHPFLTSSLGATSPPSVELNGVQCHPLIGPLSSTKSLQLGWPRVSPLFRGFSHSKRSTRWTSWSSSS